MNAVRERFIILFFAPVLLVGLASAFLAFVFPLELELREGTSWLYALSARGDVSIYNHNEVAFLNMNHGPLDPLVKGFILKTFPFLPASAVTRAFVLALPFSLLLAAACNIPTAGVLAIGLGSMFYLFILGLQPPFYLVGRSDPCAMFFFALVLAVRSRRFAPSLSESARDFSAALLSWATILSNWRFFPVVLGLEAALLLECAMLSESRQRSRKCVSKFVIFSSVGLGLVGLLVVCLFHGNWLDYYRHFFGFFRAESGWGAISEGRFSIAPRALLEGRWAVHAAAVLVIGVVWYFPSPNVSRHIQSWVWLPLMFALWLSSCAAYFLNRSGSGVYYFAPFYVILGFHLARAGNWARIGERAVWTPLVVLFYFGLPWSGTVMQVRNLQTSIRPAYKFLADARKLANGASIYSEDYHFYKTHYSGEVIDMGDVVSKVSATGYYGPALTATVNRHFAWLKANPPEFVMTGGLGSPLLHALIASNYVPVLRAPPHLWPYSGATATLLQRRP